MRHRIAAIVGMTLALVLGNSFLATAPAHAGSCTISWGTTLCGKIYNSGSLSFTVEKDYGGGVYRTLYPGQTSTAFWQDTDRFYISPGYCARVGIPTNLGVYTYGTVGSGWHKNSDTLIAWRIAKYDC